MSLMSYFPVLQEIAKIHGTFRMFVHGQNGMWRLIDQWGTQAQKDKWMPIYRAGENVHVRADRAGQRHRPRHLDHGRTRG